MQALAWSPDGRRLAGACLGPKDPPALAVWDVTAGKEVHRFRGHEGEDVTSVAWSPDGKRLASASPRTLKVWDVSAAEVLLTLTGMGFRSLTWVPDGRRLASGHGDGIIHLWDAATEKMTAAFQGHTGDVAALAWGPDGQLASASHDRTVKVWDGVTGQEALTLRGSTDAILAVAWSPDGRRLVSASGNGAIRVWDATRGYELAGQDP